MCLTLCCEKTYLFIKCLTERTYSVVGIGHGNAVKSQHTFPEHLSCVLPLCLAVGICSFISTANISTHCMPGIVQESGKAPVFE